MQHRTAFHLLAHCFKYTRTGRPQWRTATTISETANHAAPCSLDVCLCACHSCALFRCKPVEQNLYFASTNQA